MPIDYENRKDSGTKRSQHLEHQKKEADTDEVGLRRNGELSHQ